MELNCAIDLTLQTEMDEPKAVNKMSKRSEIKDYQIRILKILAHDYDMKKFLLPSYPECQKYMENIINDFVGDDIFTDGILEYYSSSMSVRQLSEKSGRNVATVNYMLDSLNRRIAIVMYRNIMHHYYKLCDVELEDIDIIAVCYTSARRNKLRSTGIRTLRDLQRVIEMSYLDMNSLRKCIQSATFNAEKFTDREFRRIVMNYLTFIGVGKKGDKRYEA